MNQNAVRERSIEQPGDAVVALVWSIAAKHGVRQEISNDDRLVDCGLTSLALVELMLAIEAHYSIALPDTELRPGNFESVRKIQQMLARLKFVS